MDVPGNCGTTPYYIEDPYIRIQRWGANLMTNPVDVESQLKNIHRPLQRDCYQSWKPINTSTQYYPSSSDLTTSQPRSEMPAWTVKDIEKYPDYKVLLLDPQENTALRFQNNIQTRILEKDYFSRPYK